MLDSLAPRERQIVDILYRRGEATVTEVREALPDPLTASTVRVMLTRLEAKGVVGRQSSERGFVYLPRVPQAEATQTALSSIVDTFFNGSALGAASALLGMSQSLQHDELVRIERMISEARKREAGE